MKIDNEKFNPQTKIGSTQDKECVRAILLGLKECLALVWSTSRRETFAKPTLASMTSYPFLDVNSTSIPFLDINSTYFTFPDVNTIKYPKTGHPNYEYSVPLPNTVPPFFPPFCSEYCKTTNTDPRILCPPKSRYFAFPEVYST